MLKIMMMMLVLSPGVTLSSLAGPVTLPLTRVTGVSAVVADGLQDGPGAAAGEVR
jgi:hypothetical protein